MRSIGFTIPCLVRSAPATQQESGRPGLELDGRQTGHLSRRRFLDHHARRSRLSGIRAVLRVLTSRATFATVLPFGRAGEKRRGRVERLRNSASRIRSFRGRGKAARGCRRSGARCRVRQRAAF
jgi:hypothetical protein